MTKTQIFEEVVSIMKHDASCCKDEKGADVTLYLAKITDDMDDEEFLFVMQSYIASFHVQGHLVFLNDTRGRIPFRVKRYQDDLYVYETAPNSSLSVGDKIIKVDDISVKEFADNHKEMLYGEVEERQGGCWFRLLSFARKITVVKADTDEVKSYPITLDGNWSRDDYYYCKKLRDNVTYIRLRDFADEEKIVAMYRENDDLIRNCDYLVIDVRNNGGGTNTAFFPLLEFCLPEGQNCADLKNDIFDAGSEINYTERNCDSRIHMIQEFLTNEIPEETKGFLMEMLEDLKAQRGKGFVKINSMTGEELPYVGGPIPKKVYIITDEGCGSSGDAFVDMMRKSSKVIVAGRPTMGIQDFTDCSEAAFGEYSLTYPTSRSLYLDNGVQMRNKGVPVDIHIPWTPEHLVRDVDLDTVLELIGQEE